jgi:hypothetical protein
MPRPIPLVEIPSRDVAVILALPDQSSVSRLVRNGKLTPTRKLPGRTGAYLFNKADVLALALERKERLEATAEAIGSALEEVAS